MMAQSNRKQVEALSAIGDIIVKLSDEDLERMESLAEQITPFDPELGDRLLEAYTLLTQLHDDVESALERLEPETEDEDMEEEEGIEIADIEAHETDAEGEEDAAEEQRKARPKRQQ